MRQIIFDNEHRQKHFDFFNSMSQPHFSLTANVDVSKFLTVLDEMNLAFTPAMVYCMASVANDIPVFRWRIREGQVVEHESVHPSFSVSTKVSDVFSFCYVDFHRDAKTFIKNASEAVERMQNDPSFEDEPGRDDYLFMSSIPWVSFTSLTHAMHYDPVDAVPRITWGKYFKQGDATLMPLSVQVHHAVVDGQDTGRFFMNAQAFFDEFGEYF